MTISDDLFRAILSMDAYNRGYLAGINFGPGSDGAGTQIGTATIGANAETLLGSSPVQAASFYAVSYTWNNHQIISYRGTDSIGLDPITGWLAAIGDPYRTQAQLAAQFYEAVINDPLVSPYNSTVEFTGHSLGGGLAGFMADLYGQKAVIFDNMPFEALTQAAHDLTSGAIYDNYYFNGASPAPTDNSQITGYYVDNEILEDARADQTTPVQAIDIGSNIDFPGVDSGLSGGNRHSASLLVLGLYAQQSVATTDWKTVSQIFIPKLFDDGLSDVVVPAAMVGNNTTSGVMRDAIAYSAIDVGTRVFGDTGIKALFDDATDLGKVPDVTNASTFVGATADSISKIFVQYAGQLAIGKKLQSQDADFVKGILTLDQNAGTLSVDLDPVKWNKTGVNSAFDVKLA